MTKALVSIIVLSYNSARHLPALFQSIAAQTYSQLELIVVDNASSDDTMAWLKQQTIIPATIIANSHNDWFSKGNNAGIQVANGEYIYICNDDIVLTPSYLVNLVITLEANEWAGMVGGKLLKLINGQPSKVIDSAGLALKPWGQVINRGEQTADVGQYDQLEQVFGITGAGMLLRRAALDQVKHGTHEYFDEDFVAYKEDGDLSWRMHRAGYQVWYQPTAVAYHARSIQQTSLTARQNSSALIRAMSYRNHWWMLIKNLTAWQWLQRLPWLLPYECAKLGYALVRERTTLRLTPELLRGISKMRSKGYVKH